MVSRRQIKQAIKVLEENLRQSAVKNKKLKDEAQQTADALNELVIKDLFYSII